MKRALGAGVALLLASAASAQAPLVLLLPDTARPAWRGIGAEEAAGSQGSMLYPAPNAAGLLAAVLTHALLVQGGREAERKARQTKADEVLAAHTAALSELTADRLLGDVRKLLPPEVAEPAQGLVLSMRPSFAMAADQRTVVLDNVIRVHAADAPSVARFEQIVRVVSDPRTEADPAAVWAADGGKLLLQEAAALVAHSTEIALTRLAAANPDAFTTQRYLFGDARKMERGQPVAKGCGRIVLRTLRESLLSVPLMREADAPPCTSAYRLSPS